MWNRLINMAEDNEIHLYSICDEIEELQYISEIGRYCETVKFYSRRNKIDSMFESILQPYPAVSRWNRQMKKDIYMDFETFHPDFIIVEFPQMLGVISNSIRSKVKIVLNQHNIEFMTMRSLSKTMGIDKKILYRFVSFQLKKYEKNIYKKNFIDLYTFVSSSDKDFFEKKYSIDNTYLFPIGAEVQKSEIIENCHNILFVAKMSYPPNEYAALWLIEKVLPLIKKEVPDVKLYLVGKEPSNKVYEAAEKTNDNVIITGKVGALDEYYNKSNIVVVPIMTGGGVNVKLLEALGKNKYVVTLPKGVDGTKFEDEKHIFVAENDVQFAKYCIDILQNPFEKEKMKVRNEGFELMKDIYAWQGIVKQYKEKLLELS